MSESQCQTELDTRTRLLEAAGPVFAARGYDRATVREICTSAGVNIASVGYHFGDKLGLYRELIRETREARERQFPTPNTAGGDPAVTLARIVRTLMSRILSADHSGWESQLFMREMQSPTPVFEDIVEQYFRPIYERLVQTIAALIELEQQTDTPTDTATKTPDHVVEHLALTVIGACVHHKVGAGAIEILISPERRKNHFDIDSLSRHITAVTLAAVRSNDVTRPAIQP